ncbi:galactose-3-O-sulfotransferase 3-like isoform X3 [Apostichopus japonicus]|uniref:galactose-3-O-sulfotransferase 3-like isoform X3 n=1 Tax=Stichopus japonicus TaxID=307972 RepID=UPI003AB27803
MKEVKRFAFILSVLVVTFVSLSLFAMQNQTLNVVYMKSWNDEDYVSNISRQNVTSIRSELLNASVLQNEMPRPATCTRQENVVYIKTHKTGSTTIQSILYRYGFARNLSFVVRKTNPHNGHIRYMKVTKDSPRKMFLPLLAAGDECSFRGYNMSAIHVVHDRSVFETFMNPGTKYITILRNPVTQLLSAFVFFNLGKRTTGNTSEIKLSNYMKGSSWKRSPYGRNSQSKDLGLARDAFDNETQIENFINRLNKELDLVLIHEYFEESVVLFSREFCWKLKDLAYTVQNNRSKQKPAISPKLLEKIRIFNHADFRLYDHFNKTFWKRVEEQGPGFWRDLREFKKLQNETMYRCFKTSNIPEGYVPGTNISNYCDRYYGGLFLFKNIYKKQKKNCTQT